MLSRTLSLFFGTALLLTPTLVGCAGADDADEAPDEESSEDLLLSGRRLSGTEVAAHLRAVGFDQEDVPRMVCTAQYESSFFDRAQNKNRNGSIDRGLFQINDIHLGIRGCPKTAEPLFDARTNAQCARAVFVKQGPNAWYGYRKHAAECEDYKIPK